MLIGMRLRYKYKLDSMARPKMGDNERLTEAVDGLYTQTQVLRDEVTELQERLDFHERLLTRARKDEGEPLA